jgi:hypothetical protein
VLRISGFKKCEVRGGLRNLHNKELHNLFPSTDLIMAIT